MQAAARLHPQQLTAPRPKAKLHNRFCVQETWDWLLETEERLRLRMAAMLDEAVSELRSCTLASRINNSVAVTAAQAQGESKTERTWLPASTREHALMDAEDRCDGGASRKKAENHQALKQKLAIFRLGVGRLQEVLQLWTRYRDATWRRSIPGRMGAAGRNV
ncbi:hypothetical protein CYMTET_38206 [Cymbomonas tetramitiformis]|uniref:Uncharacterized protein n=1 Tax=Cymbomonas tetramitiformis TaxID=36881 RepID=A0AAE0CCF8_9CHLO|nr:hypothetical protein CYMTET_38206 [Cymbomonas tetramitiformis]